MGERGGRRGVGAPFYAPPRRKTSAEIISEARAAIYGAEMSGVSSGAGSVAGGGLRPLRTRRPYTPREPQRTLFSERTRKKDTRPPSAFDLKHLSLTESSEEALTTMDVRITGFEEETLNSILNSEYSSNRNDQSSNRKKPTLRNQAKSVQERSGDGWGGFPKLPHLSGRAKPLHRRNTSHSTPEEPSAELELAQAISITRPSGMEGDVMSAPDFQPQISKSLSPDFGIKRNVFASTKSQSYDPIISVNALGDIGVKHLAVQIPNTSAAVNSCKLDSISILELCDALSHRSETDRTVLLLEILQDRLEKTTPAASLRDLVLRSLYAHIDSDDERIHVAIARAMLTMRVTGNHLAAACKLVFKIAKNDKNDHFFRDTNLLELLVEGCGRADPVSESSCCVYGAGALRVLALEPRLRARALAAGAVHLAAIHLKLVNTAKVDNPRSVSEQAIHAVYQLTGALRNLASETQGTEFLSSGALAELVNTLLHHTDRDVLTNVARCLSVLSAQESCCSWLCGHSASVRALVRALAACGARAPLAVRLAYTLGNMAAADHRARNYIYNEEGGIDVLLTILESYTKRNELEGRDPDLDPDLHLIGTDLGGSDGSNEDVLIKTVRVVANLCLTERAGRGLAATYFDRTVKDLLACLELAEKPTKDTEYSEEEQMNLSERREELATAALATLNNITFYREPDLPDPHDESLDNICRATCRWLGGGGGVAACEAARALGNLTRSPRLAQLFMLDGALDLLEPFLDHEEGSVRCSAAGVLVNVCGAGGAGGAGGAAAARALERAARRGDAAAAALLARALWNAESHAPLHATHAAHALEAIHAFIDDESVFAPCEASKASERRASDPSLFKYHVTFNTDIPHEDKLNLAASVERELHAEHASEDEACSGEDLGFEDGDGGGDECVCYPCRRLAAWEELVGVAIPLLEKLRPPRADASVGTD